MPFWEASFELDPPAPERIDNAAWQLARAARTRSTIYDSDFDGRQRPPATIAGKQRPQQMLAEAERIEAAWPHKQKGEKPEVRSQKSE